MSSPESPALTSTRLGVRLCGLCVAGVLFISAGSKTISIDAFVNALAAAPSPVLSDWAGVLAWLVVGGEAVVATSLVWRPKALASWLSALGLSCSFVIIRTCGALTECGCFGSLLQESPVVLRMAGVVMSALATYGVVVTVIESRVNAGSALSGQHGVLCWSSSQGNALASGALVGIGGLASVLGVLGCAFKDTGGECIRVSWTEPRDDHGDGIACLSARVYNECMEHIEDLQVLPSCESCMTMTTTSIGVLKAGESALVDVLVDSDKAKGRSLGVVVKYVKGGTPYRVWVGIDPGVYIAGDMGGNRNERK